MLRLLRNVIIWGAWFFVPYFAYMGYNGVWFWIAFGIIAGYSWLVKSVASRYAQTLRVLLDALDRMAAKDNTFMHRLREEGFDLRPPKRRQQED